jgi:hypothetical protein
MANSTTSISRQPSFFDRLRKEKWGPPKTNHSDRFLQPKFMTPKEHAFDMPFPDKYRSTGRPPGKYLRHSSKEIFLNISGSPSPPFDIFSIVFNNNSNNNYIGYCNNGTTTATPATNNYKTSAEGISNEDGENAQAPGVSERLADRFESNRCNYKYKLNIDGISTTTTTTTTPISNNNNNSNTGSISTSTSTTTKNDGEDAEAPGVSELLADRFESNRSSYKYKSKFNIDGISTTTTTTSTKNDDETFLLSLMIKLLSLYLIITKSFSSKKFTKEPKEKHHHHHQQQQQHYHHVKDRHQFHLEQQQNHQHFKQQHHNMERMVTSIVLKLSLVAWDMWAFRNVF